MTIASHPTRLPFWIAEDSNSERIAERICLATISGLRRLKVGASIAPPRSRSGHRRSSGRGETAAVSHDHRHAFFTSVPALPAASSWTARGGTFRIRAMSKAPMFTPISRVGVATRQLVRPLPRLEIVLDPVADFARHLGRVFLGTDHHERSAHQPHIVVLLVGLLGRGRAVAVVAGAGRLRGRAAWRIRWQVVQRSRDLARLHDQLLRHSPATRRLPRASPCWDRSVTFVSTLASSVSNSQRIVAAASTSKCLGICRPISSKGLDRRGTPLGDAGHGRICSVWSAVEQQALGAEFPQRQKPGLDVRIVLGVVAGEDRIANDVEDAVPPPVVEDQADPFDRFFRRNAQRLGQVPQPLAPAVSPS